MYSTLQWAAGKCRTTCVFINNKIARTSWSSLIKKATTELDAAVVFLRVLFSPFSFSLGWVGGWVLRCAKFWISRSLVFSRVGFVELFLHGIICNSRWRRRWDQRCWTRLAWWVFSCWAAVRWWWWWWWRAVTRKQHTPPSQNRSTVTSSSSPGNLPMCGLWTMFWSSLLPKRVVRPQYHIFLYKISDKNVVNFWWSLCKSELFAKVDLISLWISAQQLCFPS